MDMGTERDNFKLATSGRHTHIETSFWSECFQVLELPTVYCEKANSVTALKKRLAGTLGYFVWKYVNK